MDCPCSPPSSCVKGLAVSKLTLRNTVRRWMPYWRKMLLSFPCPGKIYLIPFLLVVASWLL